MTAVALVGYPLSRDFRSELERWAGEPIEYVSVAEFRRDGLRSTVARLRRESWSRALVPLEDPASRAVAPVLATAALAAAPAPILLVDRELRATEISRSRAVRGIGTTLAATAAAQVAVRRAHREIDGLLRAERATAHADGRSLLYLNGNLWFGVKAGGSVAHVAGVVNGFAALGYTVEVAAPERPPLVDDEIPFHPLPAPSAFGFPIEANSVRFSRTVSAVPLPRRGFLYQRLSVFSYAGVQLARRLGVPLVLEYNGSEAWIARHWRGRPLRHERLAVEAEDASLRHASVVVTVSEALGEELRRRGVGSDRLVVSPNGVDVETYRPDIGDGVRKELGISEDAVVATFVGTFGQWHGADVLAQAIVQLWRDDAERLARSRLHFLLIGDGLRMPDVQAILSAVPPHAVTLTGLVPQAVTPRYLAASDIAVSPHVQNEDGSPFFGSPTKLFEYMAAGTAIVASDLDQIGAILQPALHVEPAPPPERTHEDDRSVALLVRPGSVEELARGLRFLAEHATWRQRLGQNARARAVERHTWAEHVRRIEERIPF